MHDNASWLSAKVPSTVHMDLLDHDIIKDHDNKNDDNNNHNIIKDDIIKNDIIKNDNKDVDIIELPIETDSIVRSVLKSFIERSSFGRIKYGTNLDRDDLSILQWIQHTQEELMDATLYLEKLKRTILEKNNK